MTKTHWSLVATATLGLCMGAVVFGWARDSSDGELIKLVLAQRERIGTLRCDNRRVYLDRSTQTGLTPSQVESVTASLKLSGCEVASLPEDVVYVASSPAEVIYDDNELRKWLSGCPNDAVVVSVSVARRYPWDNRVAVRWSNGCDGEFHELRYAWWGYAWKHRGAEDRHEQFVTTFDATGNRGQQSNNRLKLPVRPVMPLAGASGAPARPAA